MSAMTERQIETIAERMMDRLDREYLAGKVSENSYKWSICDIERWALEQYRRKPNPQSQE